MAFCVSSWRVVLKVVRWLFLASWGVSVPSRWSLLMAWWFIVVTQWMTMWTRQLDMSFCGKVTTQLIVVWLLVLSSSHRLYCCLSGFRAWMVHQWATTHSAFDPAKICLTQDYGKSSSPICNRLFYITASLGCRLMQHDPFFAGSLLRPC